MPKLLSPLVALFLAGTGTAFATTFTTTSPTGGALPSNVTAVGGIVIDLRGLNGSRIVSEISAKSEFVGNAPANINPITIGTQTGFNSSIVSALGGGISSASFRISLYDGDTQAGNFDYNENFLLVNGLDFGNFSTVATQQTNSTGTTQVGANQSGFGNDILDTGFFSSTSSSLLASLYSSLASGSIVFKLNDHTPGAPVVQYYDFTQGLDASVTDVTLAPVVVAATPEPGSIALLATGILAALPGVRRIRSKRSAA